ncbi:MAG: hypothetical protein AAF742_04195, partial [Pseudomonadota bacterium]
NLALCGEIPVQSGRYGGTMSRLDNLCNLAADLEKDKLERILEDYNEKLKLLVSEGQSFGKVDYPKLARHVQYIAIAIAQDRHKQSNKSDGERSGRTASTSAGSKGPAWTDISNAIESFCTNKAEAFKDLLPKKVTPDRISAFANFRSMGTAVSLPNFYVALVIYLIDAEETGEIDRDFFKWAIPQRERDLPKYLFEDLSAALRSEVYEEDGDPNHEITVNFNIKRSNTDDFSNYFDRFAFSEEGRLFMVLYRPMKTKPASLMKTFLSISRHPQERHGFGYAHFYEPVDGTDQTRFSGGKVLPMQNGLYLAGGQKPQTNDGRADLPFHALKTMAFRWTDLNNNRPLLPGLVMSTNFSGDQLVSRMVARVTPIDHSRSLELREVANTDLVSNLRADLKKEATLIASAADEKAPFHENGPNFPTFEKQDALESLADRILALTNNSPNPNSGLAVSAGFSKKSGRRTTTLTNARLGTILEEAFDDGPDSFKDSDDASYDFWHDTRFAPIVIP